jgi:hypothetical protein
MQERWTAFTSIMHTYGLTIRGIMGDADGAGSSSLHHRNLIRSSIDKDVGIIRIPADFAFTNLDYNCKHLRDHIRVFVFCLG